MKWKPRWLPIRSRHNKDNDIGCRILQHGFVPGTLNCEQPDPLCGPQLALGNESADVRVALSNSFGFGGSNCTLAFARGARA